jgi:hypothetical protein
MISLRLVALHTSALCVLLAASPVGSNVRMQCVPVGAGAGVGAAASLHLVQCLRGGAGPKCTFGLDARELEKLKQLRTVLGADLTAAVARNPDFATDDRLVRLLRANQNDVTRTVKFFASMQRLRAEFGCDDIRAEVASPVRPGYPLFGWGAPPYLLRTRCPTRAQFARMGGLGGDSGGRRERRWHSTTVKAFGI